MDIPKNVSIFIIEGIPGSGKSTLHKDLISKLKGRIIYDFEEEELLFSWKHAWIEGIQDLRLEFMNKMLDYCEKVIKENSASVFIFNRFHVSLVILSTAINQEHPKGYDALIKRLREMPVHIFVPVLEPENIHQRSSHKERTEKIWELHKKKRLETRGFSNLKDMYVWEQNKIFELLKSQKIPYSTLKIVV
ncbi:MAG: AAA family ATPase [Nanoarchaeota archaeon]|nr:AAA family ATPase [Nanoarchaeota archaeon]MBU1854902.1 AAA family ATPase [Nanoarchaeota archaeon]